MELCGGTCIWNYVYVIRFSQKTSEVGLSMGRFVQWRPTCTLCEMGGGGGGGHDLLWVWVYSNLPREMISSLISSLSCTWREMPVISRQIGLRHDRTSFDKKNPKKNGAGQHTAFFT